MDSEYSRNMKRIFGKSVTIISLAYVQIGTNNKKHRKIKDIVNAKPWRDSVPGLPLSGGCDIFKEIGVIRLENLLKAYKVTDKNISLSHLD